MNEAAKFNWFEIEGEDSLKFSTGINYTVKQIEDELINNNTKVFNGIFVCIEKTNSCFLRVILRSNKDESYQLDRKEFNYDINNQYKAIKNKDGSDLHFDSNKNNILEFGTTTTDFKELNKAVAFLKRSRVVD
jgi:hypothetical protein